MDCYHYRIKHPTSLIGDGLFHLARASEPKERPNGEGRRQ